MDVNRSREALGEFLDYLAAKGLMAKGTVAARKAAASQVLGILDKSEANDVTAVNLDEIVARFGNLHGKNYTPQSLMTYKGRVRSALKDFESYLANPLAFRPSVQSRERPKMRTMNEAIEKNVESRSEPIRPATPLMATPNILPIPLRADLTVFVQGLPFDLTEAEARKIAAVVTAMAQI